MSSVIVLVTKLIEYMNDHLELCMVVINPILRSYFGKISHKNLHVLATEICKFKHELSPQIINNVFELNSVLDMRRQDLFRPRNVHSVRHGTDSLTYLGPKIWDIVPQVIKNRKLLSVFKTKIKQWVPINCPCTLCRPYSQYVGYIWIFLIFHLKIMVNWCTFRF